MERAQESFEPINETIKGKCVGADTLGAQSSEQRRSTKVHKHLPTPCYKTETRRPRPGCLPPFPGLFCRAAQYGCVAFALLQIRRGNKRGSACSSVHPSSVSLLLPLPFAITHGLRCLMLATSGFHGSQLCVNSSPPGCVFLNTGIMFS